MFCHFWLNSWQCLAMGGNGRQNAFSAVSPPFVRPTAVQHFYADDNDENKDGVNDDNDYRNTNEIADGNIKQIVFGSMDTDNTMLPRTSSRRERVQEKTIAPRSKQPTVKY